MGPATAARRARWGRCAGAPAARGASRRRRRRHRAARLPCPVRPPWPGLASPRLASAWAPAASGHLFGGLASWRARRQPGAVWRSRSVRTPRRGPRGGEEERSGGGPGAQHRAQAAGGGAGRGAREASAAARPLGSPRGDAHRSPRRWVWAGTGQGASSSSNPLALELQR